MQQRRLISAVQAAPILGVTTNRVYELVRLNLLPCVRLGRQVRIDEAALFEWIARGGQGLAAGWKNEK